jgi:hypothetical protein
MSIECSITAVDSGFLSNKNTGLGNVLFQLASTYGLAKTYGLTPSFCQFYRYIEKLKNRFGYDHGEKIFRNFHHKDTIPHTIEYKESNNCNSLYDTNIIQNIRNNLTANIFLQGYFQSHKYFNQYRDELLSLFSIDDDSMRLIKGKYPILFDTSKTCVSVHFRTEWITGIHYCIDFYKEAIQYIQTHISNPHFLIYADNIDTVRNICPTLGISYTIMENNIDYIDLWTISLCKHHILSFSTFSWWGAYLNSNRDKLVLYPYDSMRMSGILYSEPVLLDRLTEHYFPEWISLHSKSII